MSDIARRVVDWQLQHGRHDLPWQATRDPYRVWLSEIMLQQTQVRTVLGYYARFLQRFPDVKALAAAPLDDVLALWSGLGYYSRARNMHRCAQSVVGTHGGEFPRSAQGLAALPGIGPSTAAAIAAFCFGERVAILDGNVKRVLSRVLGFEEDLGRPASERRLWLRAQELMPDTGVEAYTQGLMDLGATVCLVRRPQCAHCPLADLCSARAQGRQLAFPVRLRRLKRSTRSSVLLLLEWQGQWRLQQRPPTGVWAGLWSLPEYPDEAALREGARGWPGSGLFGTPVVHALTHLDWTLTPVRWSFPARLSPARLHAIESGVPGQWLTTTEALAKGLPAPIRRWLESAEALST